MGTAVASAGAAGPFRDYGPDGAAGGLSRRIPRRADDTTTLLREWADASVRRPGVRDSEPDYLLCPTRHGQGGTLHDCIAILFIIGQLIELGTIV